jgi:hypothetical protein
VKIALLMKFSCPARTGSTTRRGEEPGVGVVGGLDAGVEGDADAVAGGVDAEAGGGAITGATVRAQATPRTTSQVPRTTDDAIDRTDIVPSRRFLFVRRAEYGVQRHSARLKVP